MRLLARERHVAPALTGVDEVVIVPARAVYLGGDFSTDVERESKWALEDDQMFDGEVQSLIEHMKIGVREAAKNPRAVHIFSGGRLTREAGAARRASSYWLVAEANDWFGADATLAWHRPRTHSVHHLLSIAS